jgi:hypothetical protein
MGLGFERSFCQYLPLPETEVSTAVKKCVLSAFKTTTEVPKIFCRT